ncbi:transposase [Ventosimonas gracilis]|uniref:Transposase n=1 Tax=Ventosimonas gracilis TaxID=1680762 RepID=A0A139SR44_9GAMM|nr:IS5 family transposase [Ventosimonas gracilis]KXU37069.1 transposase [Ventosimonas gracilis]
MPRLLLSDEHWSKLKRILLQNGVYHKRDLRMAVEGMLYRMRVGCPWRDLPPAFGSWSKVYKRFNAWCATGKWLKVFQALVVEPDLEWVFIDGSYAKAHQHSAGAAGGQEQAIGKSRAGNTSKIHMAVDAFGWPVAFEITGGQINDCTQAPALIEQLPDGQTFIADKGYDSQTIRECIERQGAKAIIPRRRNSAKDNVDMDKALYRYRHLVENVFARLKHFRAVATRFDKLKRNYQGVIAMSCAFMWLPM